MAAIAKALGLTKAVSDVTPSLSDIGGDTWVSTSGVTVCNNGTKVTKETPGIAMELRVGYDFKGCTVDQLRIIASRALDIDMQRRVRDAYKVEDAADRGLKVKAIQAMCANPVKVSEISKGDRARLSPVDKIRRMFPNLTDLQIEKMIQAGGI